MAANVDIVNRALSKLGDMRISSLGDPTKAAGLAASLFDILRDAEISAHSWNFAKARAVIPAEADKPAFGWEFQYILPSDCLRVLEAGPWPQSVMADYVGSDTSQFTFEDGRILTNLGPVLNLRYLRRVTDPEFFPPTFVEALACKLAAEMAEALTGSNSKRELAWKEYDQAVRLARRINAIGLPPQMVQDDTWMLAHRMGVL